MPRSKPKTTAQVLTTQRRGTHGPFNLVAETTEALMTVMSSTANWPGLSPVRRMVIHEVCHKMARIGAGDPAQPDHWDDIGGYLELGKNNGQPVKLAASRKARVQKVQVRPAKKAMVGQAKNNARPPRQAARSNRPARRPQVVAQAAE